MIRIDSSVLAICGVLLATGSPGQDCCDDATSGGPTGGSAGGSSASTMVAEVDVALQALADTAVARGYGDQLAVRVKAVRHCCGDVASVRMTNAVAEGAAMSGRFRAIESDSAVIEEMKKLLDASYGRAYDANLIRQYKGMRMPVDALLAGTFCRDGVTCRLTLELNPTGTGQTVAVRRRWTSPQTVLLDLRQVVVDEGGAASTGSRSLEAALARNLIREGVSVRRVGMLGRTPGVSDSIRWVQATSDLMASSIVVMGDISVEFSSRGPETEVVGLGKASMLVYRAYPELSAVTTGGACNDNLVISSFPRPAHGTPGFGLDEGRAAGVAAEEAVEAVWNELWMDLSPRVGGN